MGKKLGLIEACKRLGAALTSENPADELAEFADEMRKDAHAELAKDAAEAKTARTGVVETVAEPVVETASAE